MCVYILSRKDSIPSPPLPAVFESTYLHLTILLSGGLESVIKAEGDSSEGWIRLKEENQIKEMESTV